MTHLRLVLPFVLLIMVSCTGGTTAQETTTTLAPATTAVAPTTSDAPGTTEPATTAPTTGPAEGAEESVVMENVAFQPDELTVPAGTTVAWTNQDVVAHTTTSDDDLWGSGRMSQGDTFSFTFEEPGTYNYICTIHPAQMQGTVVVEG